MTGGRGPTARRMLPALMLLGCLLIVAALWIGGAHDAYFALLRRLGVPAFRFPFLDTHAELAVIDCHRRGIDVYVTNPCDVLGRMHVYTPLWFRLAVLPIDASWTPIVGCALALAFAASLLLLPPGRDWRAAWLICAAALSPAVAFAIERGNADLLMFVLAALAAWIALRRLPTRLLAFPIVMLAAALKVYPRPAMGVLTAAEAGGLLVGAVLILGCFVMGQSGEYRAVHLLFVLPALTALAGAPGPARRLAACTAWVILLQLWGDVASAPLVRLAGTAAGDVATSSAALLLWLARELAWWRTVAMLLALLLAMLPVLPCVAALRGRQAGRQ